MSSAGGFAFGPFQLDLRTKRLTRDGATLSIGPRHFDLLQALLKHPEDVVSKDDLINAAWPGVAVTDNRLVQVMSELRGSLDAKDVNRYIRSIARQGYTMAVSVAAIAVRQTEVDYEALIKPYLGLVNGRSAIETLELPRIAEARALFGDLLVRHPGEGPLHIGMANACALIYESTRAEDEPDREALRLADVHAREACRLLPESGEACATLGFVLGRTGDRLQAVASLRRAIVLEPVSWQHRVRHSFGTWGSERLSAAYEALALLPTCVMARCLAATVFIARGLLERAEREIDLGIAVATTATGPAARFAIVGLYWLKGVLLAARGADDEALVYLRKELALESRGHFYTRECCANTWYAVGAIHYRRGDHSAAREAFLETLKRVPKHGMAHAGLAQIDGSDQAVGPPISFQGAVTRAVTLVVTGKCDEAAELVTKMLNLAPEGDAG